MDCFENEHVCSVKRENNLGYYRIHTIWKNDRFRINIASKDASWTGEMLPENMQKTSNELQIDLDKYMTECKDALVTDDGKKGYSYSIENGCFMWKKIIDEDSGIKIRMGSVLVQPTSFVETIQRMVEVSINCKKNLQHQLSTFKKQEENELQRVSQLQYKLEEFCSAKKKMEVDIYSKFLLLLNEKKRRIQELETTTVTSVKKKSKEPETRQFGKIFKSEMRTEVTPNTSEAYEMDTDDDNEKSSEKSFPNSPQYMRQAAVGENPEVKSQSKITNKDFVFNSSRTDSAKWKRNNNEDESGNHENRSPLSSQSDCEVKNFKKESNDSQVIEHKKQNMPHTRQDILDFFFSFNDKG